jgi:hypothetical protein
MGSQVISGRPIWLGAYEFTNQLNVASIDHGADDLDGTTLADDTRVHQAGLKSTGFAIEGFFSAAAGDDSIDKQLFDSMGLDGVPVAISAQAGEAGQIAFFLPTVEGEYQPGGAVGELHKFSAGGMAQGELVRGTIHINSESETTTDDTAGIQMGAVDKNSAGQKLYAALFVTGVSGTSPTLDVIVESDDNGSFSSATTRITFAQRTDIGAQLLELDSDITDDYWRVGYTIGGTSPDFKFMVVVGIQ